MDLLSLLLSDGAGCSLLSGTVFFPLILFPLTLNLLLSSLDTHNFLHIFSSPAFFASITLTSFSLALLHGEILSRLCFQLA